MNGRREPARRHAPSDAGASARSRGGAHRRPALVVAVLGTGTEVGKTWVGAHLLTGLRTEGLAVAARKPGQSGDPGDPTPSDADVLAAASGEDPTQVCPPHRRYGIAMAPPMAAEALGLPVPTVDEVADEVTWPRGTAVGVVETAGGLLSPAAADGTAVDLARAVGCDLAVLVTDAGLGALNRVRLAVAALAGAPWPTIVVLNRFDRADPLHRANRSWLVDRDGIDVVVDVDALLGRVTGLQP